MRTKWTWVSIAALAFGCGMPPPPPVAVVGAADDLAALHGEWIGDYRSPETGRAGTIEFMLESDESGASGEVWMYAGRPPSPVGDEMEMVVKPLPIEFVRCSGDSVRGTLLPYVDPTCECTVVTEFVGTIRGDRIRGEYTTWRGEYEVARGTWEVTRRLSTQ